MGGSLAAETRRVAKHWIAGVALLVAACNTQAPQQDAKSVAVNMPEVSPWAPGKRYVYTTALQSKLVLSGQTMMGFDLAAKLALEARQVGEETEFIAQLSEAKFKADTSQNQGQFDALARELERPFGFSQKQGKLSSLQLAEGWSPFAVSISRTLAAGLQLVRTRQLLRDDGAVLRQGDWQDLPAQHDRRQQVLPVVRAETGAGQ